ncbi:4Fe-4S binding protein [Draconibacterium sp. IB214405]|uniref:nucleotide-binding protein n=1 Tax=Draconibacterium sp. IB214405 TaxID=3097352 RepID=UPI002A0F1698|nr:4Fe-4S binding protein [Draconibacterium sp. IB214405]MDX8339837.1 4Fe-4S binding protein [Draconibacterium sp. IB214405]
MKEITILSGKGGAGKTSIAAALAYLASNAVFCDNDVDAADLHLILKPEIKETYPFDSGSLAFINQSACTNCGTCQEACRFEAIHINSNSFPEVNPYQCEGCRLCERLCPVGAIQTSQNLNNQWFVSDTRFGTMVHAKMGPGEENSGKLVTRIREKAKELALENKAQFILNDGPPGIGCTAISSITGTNAVLLVIEPSISGLHDAKRLIELVNSFSVPIFAIINKYDINTEFTATVANYLNDENIPLLGKVPFSELFVESMLHEKSLIEYAPDHPISLNLKTIWKRISNN